MVVVDDHDVTRQGITASLSHDGSIRVVGEAAGSNEAITLIGQLKPDVAIVDIRLGEGSGIDVSKAAKVIAPATKLLILSAYDDNRYVIALARLGVSGYLVKTVSAQELRSAVRNVAQGWLVFSPYIAPKVKDLLMMDNRAHPRQALSTRNLTTRESEVLQQITYGDKNIEITSAMGIAVKTVEAHIERILLKLGAKSRTEAALIAKEQDWLRLPRSWDG